MQIATCPKCSATHVVLACTSCGHQWPPAPISIDETLASVKKTLSEVSSEHELEALISSYLRELRDAYRASPDSFSPEDVEFLQSVRHLHASIETFIELIEELPLVRDPGEAEELFIRLQEIDDSVGDIPLRKRVRKEIRGLRERLPEVEQRAATLEYSRRRSKIIELERRAAPCTCGHRMVIRESRHGLFWGCETFPDHWTARRLTREQLEFLEP